MSGKHSAGGRTVLDVWAITHPFPNYLDPIRAVAREFERDHPEYRISLGEHDFQRLPREVAEAAAAGRPPHLVEYYYTAGQLARDTRAANGGPLFTSIGSAVGDRTEILGEPVVIDDIMPDTRAYYTRDGRLESMPSAVSTTLLYTNTDLLRAANAPRPPRTWKELEAACRALADLPDGPEHGVTWPLHGWFFLQALAQQGALLADHDNGHSGRARKVNLATPELLTFVRWWRQLHADGHYLYTGTPGDWFGCMEAFLTRRVAFMYSSSKMTPAIVQAGAEAGIPVEASPLPYNGAVPNSGTVVAGHSYWMAAGLDETTRDGVLAFLMRLVNPDNASAWHKAQAFSPVTVTAYDSLDREGWFRTHPYCRVPTDQQRASDRSPAALGAHLGDFAGIQDAATEAMHDVLTGGVDPVTRFTTAAVRAQQALDDYNAHCVDGPVPRTPQRLRVH